MLFVIKTTYLIIRACAEPCCADSPDSPTLAEPCCADSLDSPDSPAFAEPYCADSPDSPTLAKGHFREKCDSPRQIHARKARVSQIWREWPFLRIYIHSEVDSVNRQLNSYKEDHHPSSRKQNSKAC
jgi:hypothetical protein